MSKPGPIVGAATNVCGIVLHPAGHTRSPAMHNAAFAALGLDAVYLAFDVPPEGLADAVSGTRALGLRQIAVSIPHKERVMEYVDRVDETAAAIGAVNTVTRRDGALVGSNTDWSGALRALEREVDPKDRRAVVLGAGGAARAVVYALIRAGAEVTVLNRTESRARELAGALSASASGSLADLADLPHEILVNTTSVGLRKDVSPVPAEHIRAGSVVMDAVYDPERTRLLSDAQARGARPLGGKWMLVHQAAEQLRLWSDRDAPIDVMADAFDAAGARTR
jgi:shikimate dehydrogenase